MIEGCGDNCKEEVSKDAKRVPCNKLFDRASTTFQLISDPTRLKILWLLSHYELCVNNIVVLDLLKNLQNYLLIALTYQKLDKKIVGRKKSKK